MTTGFVDPLPGHAITQAFDGAFHDPATGLGEKPGWLYRDAHGPWMASKTKRVASGWSYRSHLHCAIDQAAPVGTQIHAPERMRIVVNYIDPTDDNNHLIVAEVRPGSVLHFDHLSKVLVPVGTVIDKGATGWALTGASGHVTGPHLHWEGRHTSSKTPDYRQTWGWVRYNVERLMIGGVNAGAAIWQPSH